MCRASKRGRLRLRTSGELAPRSNLRSEIGVQVPEFCVPMTGNTLQTVRAKVELCIYELPSK